MLSLSAQRPALCVKNALEYTISRRKKTEKNFARMLNPSLDPIPIRYNNRISSGITAVVSPGRQLAVSPYFFLEKKN